MKQKLAKTLACVLAGTAIVFAGCGKNDDQATNAPSLDEVQTETTTLGDYDGQLVEDGKSYAFSDKIAFMSTTSVRSTTTTTEFIPVVAELVATVEPADANQEVIWTVEFADPTEEWAVGKTASDYVAIATNASGSTTATVTCKKPFGAQIKIVCTSAENATISAECVVDFVKAIKEITLYSYDTQKVYTRLDLNLGGITDVTYERGNVQRYGGASRTSVTYYEDYTIDFTYEIKVHFDTPAQYFAFKNGELDNVIYEPETDSQANTLNDGYLLINGIDCQLGAINVGLWGSTRVDFQRPLIWTDSSMTYFSGWETAEIENGYMYSILVTWTDSVDVFDYRVFAATLVNLVGATENYVVESVALNSSSLQFGQ